MVSAADQVAKAIESIPSIRVPIGTFVSANADGTVNVDFGNGPVVALTSSAVQPLPGDPVRCLQTDDATVMLGVAQQRSPYGQVTATGAVLLTVTTSLGSKQLPFLPSYTPRTVGDVVLIDWSGNGVVLGPPTQVPTGTYTPATPIVSGGPTTSRFKARLSGNYYTLGSSWAAGDDVWCSDNNLGCWFYGSSIDDTIPDGATIESVRVKVNEFFNQFPTSLATIGVHNLTSKTGAPTITSAVTVSAGSGWKDLPNSFGNSLKTGAKKGLGTNTGGYHKFRGRSSDSDSGLLEIIWRP